jgi:hypothetical protein
LEVIFGVKKNRCREVSAAGAARGEPGWADGGSLRCFYFSAETEDCLNKGYPVASRYACKAQLQILRLTTPKLKRTLGAPFAQDDSFVSSAKTLARIE